VATDNAQEPDLPETLTLSRGGRWRLLQRAGKDSGFRGTRGRLAIFRALRHRWLHSDSVVVLQAELQVGHGNASAAQRSILRGKITF
jgi:hypothetical protein